MEFIDKLVLIFLLKLSPKLFLHTLRCYKQLRKCWRDCNFFCYMTYLDTHFFFNYVDILLNLEFKTRFGEYRPFFSKNSLRAFFGTPCIFAFLFAGSRESLNSFRSSKKRQAPKPPKSSTDVITGMDLFL